MTTQQRHCDAGFSSNRGANDTRDRVALGPHLYASYPVRVAVTGQEAGLHTGQALVLACTRSPD